MHVVANVGRIIDRVKSKRVDLSKYHPNGNGNQDENNDVDPEH